MSKPLSNLTQELAQGRSVLVRTKGVSMEPLLREGDSHAIVQPLHREPRRGDMVLVRLPGGPYLLHRVVGRSEDVLITRGDNCWSEEQIPREWAIGTVAEIWRSGHRIPVTGLGYRLYVKFWVGSYPVRALFRRAGQKLSRWMRRLKG